MTEHVLDARGLVCPLPVLRANKALRPLPSGAELTVLATDPAAAKDFARFCEMSGHELLTSARNADDVLTIRIRKR